MAKKWRADLSVGGRSIIQKQYVQHLLAYENHVSDGAPLREISHDAKPSKQLKAAKSGSAPRPPKVLPYTQKLINPFCRSTTMPSTSIAVAVQVMPRTPSIVNNASDLRLNVASGIG